MLPVAVAFAVNCNATSTTTDKLLTKTTIALADLASLENAFADTESLNPEKTVMLLVTHAANNVSGQLPLALITTDVLNQILAMVLEFVLENTSAHHQMIVLTSHVTQLLELV